MLIHDAPADPWVRTPKPPSRAILRLFCFAHAGGGTAFFRPWREALLPVAEVCPVLLPGRESRFREPPFRSLEALLDPLCEALWRHADRPVAFLGHSMGAAVAYEAARRFAAANSQGPVCLLVSGRRAPHLPARRPPLAALPADALMAAVQGLNGTPSQVVEQKDLMQLFLPALRADFHLNDSYVPLPGPALTCPVTALGGDTDPEAHPGELEEWRYVTRGAFRCRIVSGGHFYLQGAPGPVLAAVRHDLQRALAARGGAS